MLSRFINNWLEKDQRLSAAIIRIFLGISALWSSYRLYNPNIALSVEQANPELYEPVGVLQLFGSAPPPGVFFELSMYASIVFSTLLIIGLFSRISAILAIASSLMVVSQLYSWGGAWSHGYNVVYLALIPIIFMPLSNFLSLDALIFKNYFNRKNVTSPNKGWAIQVALISVGLMYFNAFYFKMIYGKGLTWIFSDNLRNILIERYLIFYDKPLPAYLEYIVNNEWAWKTVAAGNTVAQSIAVLVIFCLNKPWLRLLLGLFFIAETIGLQLAIEYQNMHWITLFVLFVDWEYFLRKLAKFQLPKINVENVKRRVALKSLAISFSLIYLGVQVINDFDYTFTIEKCLKLYPISTFSMFSGLNHCTKPYSEHHPISLTGNLVQYEYERGVSKNKILDSLGTNFTRHYYQREIYDTNAVKKIMTRVLSMQNVESALGSFEEARWYRQLKQCPAYPEPPSLKVRHTGLIAKVNSEGEVFSFKLIPRTNSTDSFYLETASTGYHNPKIVSIDAINKRTFEGPAKLNFQVAGNKIYVDQEHDIYTLLSVQIRDSTISAPETYLTGEFTLRKNGTIWKAASLR